jgi:hypothetical protein
MNTLRNELEALRGATLDEVIVVYRNQTARVHLLLPRGGSAWLRAEEIERVRVTEARVGTGSSIVARVAYESGEHAGAQRVTFDLATGGVVVVEGLRFALELGSGT